jgi:hypothetical protein
MAFFHVHDSCAHLATASLHNAMVLATEILRSDFNKQAFVSLYNSLTSNNHNHIDIEELTAIVNKNEFISIKRIRPSYYTGMDARAVVLSDDDPWSVFLNPLLLLETQDREREAQELPDLVGVDLLQDQQTPRPFNQLAYVQQREKVVALPQPKMTPITDSRLMFIDNLELVPSGMTIIEKNTLFFTVLLLHEAHHLINRALSSHLQGPNTILPLKLFCDSDSLDCMFSDVGHFMERIVWDFCISHAGEPQAPTPFGVHEIIGTKYQNKGKKSILTATPSLRALLNNPNVHPFPAITAELLHLHPTSAGAFTQKATTVLLGRFSGGRASVDSNGEQMLIAEEEEEEEEEEDEEEEEEENGPSKNMNLPGSSLFVGRR